MNSRQRRGPFDRIIQQVLYDSDFDFESSWVDNDPKIPPNFNRSNDLWLRCDRNSPAHAILTDDGLGIPLLRELTN
jgi:hypothetical protein